MGSSKNCIKGPTHPPTHPEDPVCSVHSFLNPSIVVPFLWFIVGMDLIRHSQNGTTMEPMGSSIKPEGEP